MSRTRIGIVLLVCALAGGWTGTRAAAPETEALPTCDTPQVIAPYQSFGAGAAGRVGVAWNGREFGVAYYGNSAVNFRRYYADGTPAAAPVVVSVGGWSGASLPVCLLWNGSQYAMAWGGGTNNEPYLAILSAAGALLYGPTAASTATSLGTNPSLAWSGSGYALVWNDSRSGNADIYATLFNADATIANGGASHDLAVCTAANNQGAPSVAWSANGAYVIVWQDFRTGTKYEIYQAALMPSGAVTAGPALVSGASSSYAPSLVGAGGGFGMAWYDTRDGNNEIYFARLDAGGGKIGADLRLTNNVSDSNSPFLAWTGGEYGVFWRDNSGGTNDVWFQRVSSAGAALGSAVQLLSGINISTPGAGFATHGYLASASYMWYAGYLQPLGCSYPVAPPCPENAIAYNISGTQATLAWLPVVDLYLDVAYYQVYRNDALVGTTSSNVFTDTGLALNTTYNYSIRTVDAGQWVSTGCPAGSSVYVKTNAALLLAVNKSVPNALLTWNDGGLNNYNVYRGTDPQVMRLVGSTAGQSYQDANVLNDAILYFYTVDDPGQ